MTEVGWLYGRQAAQAGWVAVNRTEGKQNGQAGRIGRRRLKNRRGESRQNLLQSDQEVTEDRSGKRWIEKAAQTSRAGSGETGIDEKCTESRCIPRL